MQRFADIEAYLAYVGRQRGSAYGKQFRQRFRDSRGTAELAMLAAPSEDEFEQMRRLVAIMTPYEKAAPQRLSDEQIKQLAHDAGADPGVAAIFINGYVLASGPEAAKGKK